METRFEDVREVVEFRVKYGSLGSAIEKLAKLFFEDNVLPTLRRNFVAVSAFTSLGQDTKTRTADLNQQLTQQ